MLELYSMVNEKKSYEHERELWTFVFIFLTIVDNLFLLNPSGEAIQGV